MCRHALSRLVRLQAKWTTLGGLMLKDRLRRLGAGVGCRGESVRRRPAQTGQGEVEEVIGSGVWPSGRALVRGFEDLCGSPFAIPRPQFLTLAFSSDCRGAGTSGCRVST